MNYKAIIVVVLVILVAGFGAIIYSQNTQDQPALEIPGDNAPQTNPLISVSSPLPNAQVSSPMAVTGQARGNWYFEASFPVKLYDANNTLLATDIATALSDWMTTDFVAFTATLNFPTPSTATGTLVLEKDNPSGEPQNDDSISIPVNF
ncbi:MAG: hypothetical protein A2846_02045 [Candidatus Doudnabacteria bacterium RIFCSPHIGHO2_01_FULL_49_9]|uniref:Bacterial spore germination immunoglobulin-like domain-containing protein n=1 Tax=Candidatus Doudnabacteria bacterium RIFCSPHIGHO2_01_FULL_49_9 TaxID=1817827 RepID=A0A1F5P348_9BACT|nr:MAG: hypothetical protein A2846_02045 [Candidatus Doudnabacteria bacterium RIFCSPHIGHO2_01_FULL_49_9]